MNKFLLVVFGAAMFLVVFGLAFALTGWGLFCVWEFAIRAAWPTLPYMEWWQFGLIALGINWIANLFKVTKK